MVAESLPNRNMLRRRNQDGALLGVRGYPLMTLKYSVKICGYRPKYG
jgi:hypothetical protein